MENEEKRVADDGDDATDGGSDVGPGNPDDHTEPPKTDDSPGSFAASGPTGSPGGAGTSTSIPAGWYPDPQRPNGGQQRFWDGVAWTEKIAAEGKVPVGAPAPAISTERKSPDERRALLAQQIQFAAGRGRRIESQSEYQAVLVSGHPVNNTLHVILTIFTCLLWGIVWAIIAGTGGERREMVLVDEFGNVQYTSLGKA